jgi:hypothetical protein
LRWSEVLGAYTRHVKDPQLTSLDTGAQLQGRHVSFYTHSLLGRITPYWHATAK